MISEVAASPSALDYWTLAIALVGAITGVAALTTQITSFLLAGPWIKVYASSAVATADGRWYLSVNAINKGRMPVTVAEVGVLVEISGEDEARMPLAPMHAAWWTGESIPHRLIDGESVTWLTLPAAIVLSLNEHKARPDVRVYVRLATGKTVRSGKRIDVNNLASLTTG